MRDGHAGTSRAMRPDSNEARPDGEAGFALPRRWLGIRKGQTIKQSGAFTMTADTTALAKTALIEAMEKIHNEVCQLTAPLSDGQFWTKPIDPGNSVGHLVLHLTGNLNHFVGGQLGGSGYVRDREREFTEKQLPSKTEALAKLDDAVATFRRVVSGLSAEQLAAPHPEARLGVAMSALAHVLAHFALHRGQMSYIVRLLPR
jgi:uncharacterized damage-inducible protein DinB